MTNSLSITLVYPVIKTIVQKGYSTEPIFQAAGFDPRRLQHADNRIETEQLKQLIEAAAQHTGDDYFGLSQGMLMEFADLGILGYVISHSKTVGDALQAYLRYYQILMDCVHTIITIEEEQLVIRFIEEEALHLSRHCMDEMAVGLSRIIKALAMQPLPLRQVSFTYEQPGSIGPYIEAFGLAPQFAQRYTELRFDKDILNCEVMYADHYMLQAFEEMAQAAMKRLLQGKQFSDRVIEWMHQCMPNSFPTLKQTAEAFYMSERRLQQKLAEEQTTFIQLANQVKKELAISLLKQDECSISQIAYLLHFAEPSSLQNAFKRWTGKTPGQYRLTLQPSVYDLAE